MKKKLIRAGVLTAVFIVACIVISILTNRGNADMTADLGAAALPGLEFEVEGQNVNMLAGYVEEMDLTAMRDTITPIAADGSLKVKIDAYENQIQSLKYEVISLDGQRSLLKVSKKKPEAEMSLMLKEALTDEQEAVLKVTLNTGSRNVYFYTRIISPEGLNVKACMDFAKEFSDNAMGKEESYVAGLIESSDEGDNTTLQEVTIHSDVSQVTWGKLSPSLSGDIQTSIKETNSSYTSILYTYAVTCQEGEDKTEVYNVKEYFKVRNGEEKMYLLDYSRTMNQVFDGNGPEITEKGVDLGIAPADLPYLTNADGTIVSFVSERALWNYNKDADELSMVFSFTDSENKDPRSRYDQHEIKLINMDKEGSTTFAIYGYMNRGQHEGKVGVSIYYFDIQKNSVEEKAFIPSNKSYGIVKSDLGKLVYYSREENLLYVMVEGKLYKVNLSKGDKEIIVKGLQEGQYAASEDGKLLAYQKDGGLYDAGQITVLDLENGNSYEVSAGDNETIRPLGFIYSDFIYGAANKNDLGKTISGEKVLPMYKVEIRDSSNQIAKTYQVDQTYILDVFIEGNMLTMNQVMKNGDTYMSVAPNYITNNQEKEESNITLKSYTTDTKETQMRLAYEGGIKDKNPKILNPKQVLFESPITVGFDNTSQSGKYYLYARGELAGVYDKAGYAVQKAESLSGVVISSSQAYVWESSNRDLRHEIEGVEGFRIMEGESTLAAGVRTVLLKEGVSTDVQAELNAGKSPMDIINQYTEAEAIDLSGCTVEEVLYVINKDTPVIALTDSSNAVVLTGYGTAGVTYVDLSTGAANTVPMETVTEMTAGSGNTFISYIK